MRHRVGLATGERWYGARIAAGDDDFDRIDRHRLPRLRDEDWLPLCVLTGVDDRTVDVAEEAIDRATAAEIMRVVGGMHTRTQFVVRERYERDRTFEDIGYELGLSRDRIRQIINDALKLLKGLLHAD